MFIYREVRRKGGLEQGPAQRRWSLTGEVSGGAGLVGLVHGDVQAGVADRFARGREAAGVAELGEDRDGGQRADAVVIDIDLPPSNPNGSISSRTRTPGMLASLRNSSQISR